MTPPPAFIPCLGVPRRLVLMLAATAKLFSSPGPQVAPDVALAGYAVVLRVDVARGDDLKGDGSVAQPLATLPRALEAAGRPGPSQRVAILVAEGRYTQPTLALKPRVDLYGGFSPGFARRDIYQHPAVLDGVEAGRIALGADDVRFDGFHLRNGRVRGKGAALFCDGVSPLVTNCVFTNNRTLIPVPWNPPLLHETGHDGGAVMVLNGAAPRFEHCLFYDNSTECGRGGALASDRGGAPVIRNCVFANNRAGLVDPMRSSDGGAVSFFDWSMGKFDHNVVVANEALTKNDAGGVFIALWSAPTVHHNVIVANKCGDDAGGLFLGGQEHRYDAPLDAYPPADKFNIDVVGNLFVGNANGSGNSGAMRITMETRARLAHNVIAENHGGFYLQRSEIHAERNTVWQDWQFVEDKPTLGPSRFTGNVLKGPVGPIESRATFRNNMAPPEVPGGPHVAVADIFLADGVDGALTDLRFDPVSCTTTLTTKDPLPPGDLAGRAVRLSDSATGGQWRVIARTSGNEIVLWGRLDAVTKAPRFFSILRTFTCKSDAPADLGAVRGS
jgi:hypothetical protein